MGTGTWITPADLRKIFFDHFVTRWALREPGFEAPSAVTGPRLRKAKETIMRDSFLWENVLGRHNADGLLPHELERKNYEHCMTGFWAIVAQIIRRGSM